MKISKFNKPTIEMRDEFNEFLAESIETCHFQMNNARDKYTANFILGSILAYQNMRNLLNICYEVETEETT